MGVEFSELLPPGPTPPEPPEMPQQAHTLLKRIAGSAIVVLLITCLIAALTFYGVINVVLGRVFLFLVFILGVGGVVFSEWLWKKNLGIKITVGVLVCLLWAGALIKLDLWARNHGPTNEAIHTATETRQSVEQKMESASSPTMALEPKGAPRGSESTSDERALPGYLVRVNHRLVLDKKAQDGKPMTLRLVLTNSSGRPLQASYRFYAGVFPGDLTVINPDEGWKELQSQQFVNQELTSQGQIFFDITTANLTNREAELVNHGEHTPYFMFQMRQTINKQTIVEVCAFLSPSGDLMSCRDHNLP